MPIGENGEGKRETPALQRAGKAPRHGVAWEPIDSFSFPRLTSFLIFPWMFTPLFSRPADRGARKVPQATGPARVSSPVASSAGTPPTRRLDRSVVRRSGGEAPQRAE